MKELLDLTWKTLEHRMRNHRRASIAIWIWAALLILLLAVLRDARALLWLLALPPFGLFMAAQDHRLMRRWEGGVLETWRGGTLPMDIFKYAITVNPTGLKSTRAAMASLLPADAGDAPPDPTFAGKYVAAAERRNTAYGARLSRNGLRFAAFATVALAVAFMSDWRNIAWVCGGSAAFAVAAELLLARRCRMDSEINHGK